jgi:hypothetical protein
MKKYILSIALILIALPAVAQDSGTYEVSWGSALLGALGAAVAAWVGGLASKARLLGEALMDRWIKKIKEK